MFDDAYKTVYSHGLEQIYAVETIDLKTVRKLNSKAPQVLESPVKTVSEADIDLKNQLEFDLGDFWRGTINSFLLEEPVQTLCLSQHAEKCLIENSKFLIRDLVLLNSEDFMNYKGMGQGHIDEVQQKLNAFTNGKKLFQTTKVDFLSLLRATIGPFERKKVWPLLDKYHLAHALTLTPLENAEIRRLNAERKADWETQVLNYLHTEAKQQTLANHLEKVVNVFIIPWIYRRGGVATQHEIEERLQRISTHPEHTDAVFHLFGNLYYNDLFPLSTLIHEAEDTLYCANSKTYHDYQEVAAKAESYFYRRSLSYPLKSLIEMLVREFSLQWQCYSDAFIEKVLTLSPRFRLSKDYTGNLSVKLS